VVKGMDVVEAISQLPSVKANKGSPFFKCALPPNSTCLNLNACV